MIQRFKIEDLVVQDSSGVIFSAFDTETNRAVAVRRFLPFGPDGGGLSEEQKSIYQTRLARLSEINHHALRPIVCGGCDPVDGMPFVATEWIEGHSLQELLNSRPLSEPEAVTLLGTALEICQILSEALETEGIWVDTDTNAVTLSAPETQRPVSFWISPLVWLGTRDGKPGLEPLIALTHSVMGWPASQTGGLPSTGIGAWLRWLYGSAPTATLNEARVMLATVTGTPAPQPTKRVVRQAARPILIGKKKSSAMAPVLVFTGILIATGLGGWYMIRRNESQQAKANEPRKPVIEIVSAIQPASPPPATPKPVEPESTPPPVEQAPAATASATAPVESREDRAKRLAVELTSATRQAVEQKEANAAALKQKIASRKGVFSPADHDLLVPQNNKDVVVEGTLKAIGYSSSKKTMYLEFANTRDAADFRGAIASKDATGQLSASALGSLIGKKIRLAGKIRLEPVGTRKRPVIDIANRTAIK